MLMRVCFLSLASDLFSSIMYNVWLMRRVYGCLPTAPLQSVELRIAGACSCSRSRKECRQSGSVCLEPQSNGKFGGSSPRCRIFPAASTREIVTTTALVDFQAKETQLQSERAIAAETYNEKRNSCQHENPFEVVVIEPSLLLQLVIWKEKDGMEYGDKGR